MKNPKIRKKRVRRKQSADEQDPYKDIQIHSDIRRLIEAREESKQLQKLLAEFDDPLD